MTGATDDLRICWYRAQRNVVLDLPEERNLSKVREANGWIVLQYGEPEPHVYRLLEPDGPPLPRGDPRQGQPLLGREFARAELVEAAQQHGRPIRLVEGQHLLDDLVMGLGALDHLDPKAQNAAKARRARASKTFMDPGYSGTANLDLAPTSARVSRPERLPSDALLPKSEKTARDPPPVLELA